MYTQVFIAIKSYIQDLTFTCNWEFNLDHTELLPIQCDTSTHWVQYSLHFCIHSDN